MSKVFIFIFLLTSIKSSYSGNGFSIAEDILDILKNVVYEILGIEELVEESIEEKIFTGIKVLQNAMDEMNSKMENIETEIRSISDSIRDLPGQIKQAIRLNDLGKYTARLESLYRQYETYSKNLTHFEKHTLEDFANIAVSHDSNSISDLMDQIHALIVPPYSGLGEGILNLLATSLQKMPHVEQCKLHQSPYQIVYNIYYYVALTELKGYIAKNFSYMLLRIFNKGNFTSEIQDFREVYEHNIKEETALLKNIIKPLSRDFWKCDPILHHEGQTYLEITELLQGYIQNEGVLNSFMSCDYTCAKLPTYPTIKSYGCDDALCSRQRTCNGRILNCTSIPEKYFSVCFDHNSTHGRRYSYIKDRNSEAEYGRRKDCDNINETTSVYDWTRGFLICEFCFCFCDEIGQHSDRYFSLRPVMADVKNNRVVIGLKFAKKNRIIHLQIKEGRLLPRGNIDPSTIRWVPVEDYKITDFNANDYHTLTLDERGINFDDVLVSNKHVLTGVRLVKEGSHLKLAITGNAFNSSTGRLIIPENPNWISRSLQLRKELKLEAPDLPTESSSSIPNETLHSFIQFTHTDIYKDIAQKTVPYLDAQPVESSIPTPLGGAGLYYKGKQGFGGFIAPKIVTYDFGSDMD